MEIEIIKTSSEKAWYKDKVGERFKTYGDAFEYGSKGNVVYFIENVSGFKFVAVEDAIIISDKTYLRGVEPCD